MDNIQYTRYGYSRVSTEEQNSSGYSLKSQEEIGREDSERNGFSDYIHYNEGIISGKTIE